MPSLPDPKLLPKDELRRRENLLYMANQMEHAGVLSRFVQKIIGPASLPGIVDGTGKISNVAPEHVARKNTGRYFRQVSIDCECLTKKQGLCKIFERPTVRKGTNLLLFPGRLDFEETLSGPLESNSIKKKEWTIHIFKSRTDSAIPTK